MGGTANHMATVKVTTTVEAQAYMKYVQSGLCNVAELIRMGVKSLEYMEKHGQTPFDELESKTKTIDRLYKEVRGMKKV